MCKVLPYEKRCILGDYSGQIQADFTNMKYGFNIEKNDTLQLRYAKIMIRGQKIVLVVDREVLVQKADHRHKFSHHMEWIPKTLFGERFMF